MSKCCHAETEKTLNPDQSSARQAKQSGYICPMCPEVFQSSLGNCPSCGMTLVSIRPFKEEFDPELRDMTLRLIWGLLFTLPLFMMGMAKHLLGVELLPHLSEMAKLWVQWGLSTPVVLGCGSVFFQRAWQSVWYRSFNMFTLIALGVGVTYGVSILSVIQIWLPLEKALWTGGVYFESAAMIVSLTLFGQVLELKARKKTGDALAALLDLTPSTVQRVSLLSGEEETVSIELLEVGDQIRVLPGQAFPADGVLCQGVTAVDESLVTGESFSVEKREGDAVIGGSLNGASSVVMKVSRLGGQSFLGQMVSLLQQAQRSRLPIQETVDRVAAWFVPIVLWIAVITFLGWLWFGPGSKPDFSMALTAAVSVLVIACPCALGLATPMSIAVGVGRGARMGILFQNPGCIEAWVEADWMLMDKTGTLTVGKPSVAKVFSLGTIDEATLLQQAASLEKASEHPLSSALITAAKERSIPLEIPNHLEVFIGKGIAGEIKGRKLWVGNPALMQEANVTLASLPSPEFGCTRVYVAETGNVLGVIDFEDPIKPSAQPFLKNLLGRGVDLGILSGDATEVVEEVNRRLDCPFREVHGSMLPEEKLNFLKKLQKKGHRVVMVGDGINDAPVLTQADVSIAMGTGSDVSIQTADMTVLKGDLLGIVHAMDLGKAMRRNIHQNLGFAFVYNLLAIPLAAGVLYPFFGVLLSPMVGAVAMSLSSVSVIGNALRLRHWSPPHSL